MSEWLPATLSSKKMAQAFIPLVNVLRGETVESVHLGALAVCDAIGALYASIGDPAIVTYMRSSAKPFQALALVESGALERLGLSVRELAVIAGSHGGELIHTQAVDRILRAVGCTVGDLACGIHPPADPRAARLLDAAGQEPDPRHNNCSGKHAGMLALARELGATTTGYIDPQHPAQVRVRQVMADLLGLEADALLETVTPDGCSAPAYAAPLSAMARAFARLVDPPAEMSPERAQACRIVADAMRAHPEMVGATTGRLDTEVMRAAPGLLVKSGAEGVLCAGLAPGTVPGVDHSLGLALKIADGDLARRSRTPATIEALRQLGALSDAALECLAEFRASRLTNWAGLHVGRTEVCFTLERP